MTNILTELNPAQQKAVEAVGGPVLVLAGPGSGKTRVIAHRVAYLIKTCGVSPRRIMAVTFTNKAAREMKERLELLVGSSVGDLTLGTFHAICARILHQDGLSINVDPHFVIYDGDDQLSLLKRAMQEIGLDPKQYSPEAVRSAISAAKSLALTPTEYFQRGRSYFEEIVGRAYERYQQLLSASKALDFDDLLMKVALLFRQNDTILAKYQAKYVHILVDEFQDTNLVQYEIIRHLGGKYRNICVVGDPDQSIYSWRSADPRNIHSFEKDYPEAETVILEQNYRSTKLILETASGIISANQYRKPKGLWTDNNQGERITVTETYTEYEEAQFVISEIERLVEKGKARLGDCSIMYRTNAQSRALEEAFIRYGVPYKLVAGTRFYERREVKDVIAYLRLIHNPYDTVSLLRVINVPTRGVGQQTTARLAEWANSLGVSEYEALKYVAEAGKEAPFSPHISRSLVGFAQLINGFTERSREIDLVSLFDLVVEASGYKEYVLNAPNGEERWENILELRGVAQQYRDLPPDEALAAFLEGVTLVADVDGLDGTADAVTLITLHQAKGLEFPTVFIVGLEEGVLPHFKSLDDSARLEEERRLCYVGVTRAKERLYLIYAMRRNLRGGSMTNSPSRFLRDIPAHIIQGSGAWGVCATPDRWPEKPSSQDTSSIELKAGDHVRHAQFGGGIVVSCRPTNDDTEVVIAFSSGAGIKKLSLNFARLEKVV